VIPLGWGQRRRDLGDLIFGGLRDRRRSSGSCSTARLVLRPIKKPNSLGKSTWCPQSERSIRGLRGPSAPWQPETPDWRDRGGRFESYGEQRGWLIPELNDNHWDLLNLLVYTVEDPVEYPPVEKQHWNEETIFLRVYIRSKAENNSVMLGVGFPGWDPFKDREQVQSA